MDTRSKPPVFWYFALHPLPSTRGREAETHMQIGGSHADIFGSHGVVGFGGARVSSLLTEMAYRMEAVFISRLLSLRESEKSKDTRLFFTSYNLPQKKILKTFSRLEAKFGEVLCAHSRFEEIF